MAALAIAVAYAVATGGRLAPLALAAGVLALGLFVVGIVLRRSGTIPWAVLFVAGGYLAGRAGKDVVDGWAAALGVLLLLAAELAMWSIEHHGRIRSEGALVVRRILTLAVLAVSALVVNVLLLGTAAAAAPAGVLLAAVGVTAAVGAVAIVLRLARPT